MQLINWNADIAQGNNTDHIESTDWMVLGRPSNSPELQNGFLTKVLTVDDLARTLAPLLPPYLVNNGLSYSGTTIQLGGPLIHNTTIAAGTYTMEISSLVPIKLTGDVEVSGNMDAATYSAAGTPGFNGTVGNPTSITVVNGIVTSIT